MPRGKHVGLRPSGSQQRKRKKERNKLEDEIRGSMDKFVCRPAVDIEGNNEMTNEIEISDQSDSDSNRRETGIYNDFVAGNQQISIINDKTFNCENQVEENKNETWNDGENNYISDNQQVTTFSLDHNSMNQTIMNNEEQINETDSINTLDVELDPFYWKIPVSDSFRVQLVEIGSGPLQN